MAITALLSLPSTQQQTLLSQRRHYTNNNALPLSIHSSKSLTFIHLCSPSSSASVVDDSPPSAPVDVQSEPPTLPADDVPFGVCKACGREEIEKGCNGEGRIQGGIATVPGFGWWPIKAYRPCPGLVASGGRYTRRGQSMDQVVSGASKPAGSLSRTDEVESSSKNRRDPRRFKR